MNNPHVRFKGIHGNLPCVGAICLDLYDCAGAGKVGGTESAHDCNVTILSFLLNLDESPYPFSRPSLIKVFFCLQRDEPFSHYFTSLIIFSEHQAPRGQVRDLPAEEANYFGSIYPSTSTGTAIPSRSPARGRSCSGSQSLILVARP